MKASSKGTLEFAIKQDLANRDTKFNGLFLAADANKSYCYAN